MKTFLLVLFLFSIATSSLFGQSSPSHKTVLPVGISVDYGSGHYSVRDEYISGEKYSGILPYFTVNWARFHKSYGYRMGLEFLGTSEIKNNNVSADATQFTGYLEYIYPAGKTSFFSKDVFFYLGPTMELFVYDLQYNFVKGGNSASAEGVLLSLGFNFESVYLISSRLKVENFVRLSIFSIGGKSFDENRHNESDAQLFTIASAMNTNINFSTRYDLSNRLSIKLGYLLQVSRINAWDPFLSASNNLIGTVNYHF